MIFSLKYICRTDGKEKTSSNISHKVRIGYNLFDGSDGTCCEGTIEADCLIRVKCDCGETHEFLVADKVKHI